MTITQHRQCTACKTSFVGLPSEDVCPNCDDDEKLYLATRRAREPRAFLPYPQLLKKWRHGHALCRSWRKTNEAAHAAIRRARELEEENATLRGAVGQSAEDLATEVRRLRRDLAIAAAMADHWRKQAPDWQKLVASVTADPIPPDKLKRLRSLCHPDHWVDRPQEKSATEISQWLNTLNAHP